jgi:hypothetical protein
MKAVTFVFPVLTALAVLHGCTMSKSIVSQAVDINTAIEQAENRMIVMNVLRARDNMPMYFTSVTAVRGSSPAIEGGASFSLPFGNEASAAYGFSPFFSANRSMSYDVSNLHTHQFMRGITRPIDIEGFKYYWDMGWPRSLLLSLFVESIRLYDVDRNTGGLTIVKVFDNYPGAMTDSAAGHDDKARHGGFKQEIESLISDELIVVYKETVRAGETDRKDADRVVSLERGSVKPAGQCDSYIFRNSYRLTLPPEKKAGGACKSGRLAVLYLRSPEAIIYYLGEIVREQLSSGNTKLVTLNMGHRQQALFVLEKVSSFSGNGSLVDVEYNGEKYSLLKQVNGVEVRSAQVLSLLTKLIGQYKYSEEMPKTPTVRLVE